MYSKRKSKRAPGSVHAPCTFQLVFTMQNAAPHEARVSLAAPASAAAPSSQHIERFITFSRSSDAIRLSAAHARRTTVARCRRRRRVLRDDQEKGGGARGRTTDGGDSGNSAVPGEAGATRRAND